jgi:DNA-directed DNA polymerase III PolC
MLIVADYVAWARSNNIPVGPGRGSVGGSLVAWLLNIHQADPIKYGLVFARFYNRLKGGMSDIDMDFAQSSREAVVAYIVKKYGQEHVAQISNFVGMTPKVYVRDISRACGLGGSRTESVELGNDAADSIPNDIKTMDAAYERIPLFAEYVKRYPELMKYRSIANKPRNTSLHAAGVIISNRPLHTIVPVRRDKDNIYVIEYDKDVAEANGLVKMDILGLTTLDIIEATNKLIIEAGKTVPTIDYEVYDKETYDLISNGDTFGVFQFGTSGGTIDLCKQIKPKSIEDLAIITTLARPMAKEIRKPFVKTRNGLSKVKLMHSSLQNAFEQTLGYPLYDESLLILAKDVAGWDYDEADKLRKLTKEKGKHPEKVAKWREEFIAGSVKNNIPEEIGRKVWDEIVSKFGAYSFNKAHAVLYSMVSYHTAYLKAHFPIEFLMANLMDEIKSNSPKAAANIQRIKNEIRARGVKILPPDINASQLHYTMKDGQLITGLDAIKFVSDDAIIDIISKRPFKSFQDFITRTDSRKVRANTIGALAAAGCLDWCNIPRHLIFLYCSDFRKKLTVWLKSHSPNEEFVYPWPKEKAWSMQQIYAMEYRYTGEGFSCRPKDAYGSFFTGHPVPVAIDMIKKMPDKTQIPSVKCIIRDFFEFRVKKDTSKYFGKSMIKAVIEDANGDQCGLTIFPDRYEIVAKKLENMKMKLEPGIALHFAATSNSYEDDMGLILETLYAIVPMPQCPNKADLKSKRVSMRLPRKKKEGKPTVEVISEEIEDELIAEGLIEPEIETEDF